MRHVNSIHVFQLKMWDEPTFEQAGSSAPHLFLDDYLIQQLFAGLFYLKRPLSVFSWVMRASGDQIPEQLLCKQTQAHTLRPWLMQRKVIKFLWKTEFLFINWSGEKRLTEKSDFYLSGFNVIIQRSSESQRQPWGWNLTRIPPQLIYKDIFLLTVM